MLKLKTKPKPTVSQDTPYTAAIVDSVERWQYLHDATRHARWLALISVSVALVAVAHSVYVTTTKPFQPFPVLLDHLGRSAGGSYAGSLSYADADRIKRATLGELVVAWRTVTTDGVFQQTLAKQLASRIGRGSAAHNILDAWWAQNKPEKRAASETVAVEGYSVLPLTEHTYQVDWSEAVRNLQGDLKTTEKLRAVLTIAVSPPTTEKSTLANPLGIYLTNLSWASLEKKAQ